MVLWIWKPRSIVAMIGTSAVVELVSSYALLLLGYKYQKWPRIYNYVSQMKIGQDKTTDTQAPLIWLSVPLGRATYNNPLIELYYFFLAVH